MPNPRWGSSVGEKALLFETLHVQIGYHWQLWNSIIQKGIRINPESSEELAIYFVGV